MRPIPSLTLIAAFVFAACTFAAPTVTDEQAIQITATPGAIPLDSAQPIGGEATAPPPPTATPVGQSESEAPSTGADNDDSNDFFIAGNPEAFVGPSSYPEGVNPLTGLPVDDPASLERRPMVVKISNAPPLVRPQHGIGQADLVYEHYAEGGLTRFSAVFYGQTPERVGSIRSGRLIDFELAAMYQALLVFSGGSTGVEERIYGSEAIGIAEARLAEGRELVPPSDFADRAFKGVLYGPPYYFRDENVPVPHNLFASPSAVWELASNQGVNGRPSLSGMTFSPEIPPGEAAPASLVDVRYRATRVQWWYNAERNVYERMSDGQWHSDAATDQIIAADNVVILFADHQFTDIVESEWQGNQSFSIEVRLWFEGEAMVARDGRWYRARWERPTRESLMMLRTESGEIFPLKPGRTWFQAVRLPEQQEPESEWVRVE
jgi:hypothetical protein